MIYTYLNFDKICSSNLNILVHKGVCSYEYILYPTIAITLNCTSIIHTRDTCLHAQFSSGQLYSGQTVLVIIYVLFSSAQSWRFLNLPPIFYATLTANVTTNYKIRKYRCCYYITSSDHRN